MASGEQLVSTMAIIGIPSLRASFTAMSSWLTSTMNSASGSPFMSLMPPRLRSSLSRSRVSCSTSFLTRCSMLPSSLIPSSCFKRFTEARMVRKLVSIPPSQRCETNGMPQRLASSSTATLAARFVPTNMMEPRLAAILLMKFIESISIGRVFSRLIIWILPRAPKMKGAILGFQ